MHSSHVQSSSTFATLLAGLNRIRFIQKRQASNHNKVAQHLTLMVNRFSQQRAKEGTGGGKAERMSDERYKEKMEGSSLTRTNTSRQKFKIHAGKGKYALQTTQQDSSLLKQSMDFEDSIVPAPSTSQQTRPSAKLKQLVESKTANYRMMKEREQQIQVIRRLRSQQSQRILRERVALAAAKKQEGRRRIEDNYFSYIENIHLEKGKEKATKTHISEQQHKEMVRLQFEQKSQLEQFQSSLALEEQLKSFIKERLPPGAVLG